MAKGKDEDRKQVPNFLTYVRERMDTFAERPLCSIDSLVFTWLSYARMGVSQDRACTSEGIALHELLRAEDFEHMFGTSWDPKASRDLLFAACASPRFRDTRLTDFCFKTDHETEEQFAAMTFRLPDGSLYVAFRGTDSTIVGWKEDFNMTFLRPIPAQGEAADYLNAVAAATDGPLYVGGHSKGGNLAVYAAAMLAPERRSRLKRVFSHDGPGFQRAFVAGEAYQGIEPIMEKTLPKSSIIGMLMYEGDGYTRTVVESDGFSLLQHNPFLWAVDVDACAFVEADGLSVSSRYFDRTLDAWLDKYGLDERQRFVDALFDVIRVTGVDRFADIMDNRKIAVPLMLDATEKLDPEARDFVKDMFVSFAKTATIERVTGAAGGILDTLKSTAQASGPVPREPDTPRDLEERLAGAMDELRRLSSEG